MKELKNFQHNSNQSTEIPKDLSDALGKYSGMSENALIEALLQKVKQQKSSGEFDKEQLRSFVQTMGTMLNSEQSEKLENLIKIIDED